MLWAGSKRAVLYVGEATACAVQAGTDAPLQRWFSSDTAPNGMEQALQWLAEQAGTKSTRYVLDIQLSGAVARPFVFEVAGLKSRREADEVASTLAPEATGLIGPCTVWLDDWTPGHRCMAVAIESSFRDEVEALAKRFSWRISAMRPWWSLAIDATLAASDISKRLAVIEDTDAITVLTSAENGNYSAAATYAPKPASAQVRALLTRAALAANVTSNAIVSASMTDLPAAPGERDTVQPRRTLVPKMEPWA